MENIKGKVSVITICHNCKADLEKTIQSVVAQTYDNREFIVVDGDSTDGTKDVLSRYQHVIDKCISESDDGIYDALNKGVRLAAGEWIICMNAGDTFTSSDVLYNIFNSEIPEGTAFIYSDFWLCHPDGTRQLRTTDRAMGEIHHQNAIYKRELHERYGYYVVTHPYIVSDLLFFLAIPQSYFYKTSTIIADVKADGISDSSWCTEQALAAKAVYGMETIPSIFRKYIRMHLALWLRGIKNKVLFQKSNH